MFRAPGPWLGACLPGALLGALLVALPACTTSGGAGAGDVESTSIRVTLRDYGSARKFELASEGHTDRLRYYSEARDDASRKIQANEVMQALADELNRQGYARYAAAGRAPSAGSSVISRAFEMEVDGVTTAWATGSGSPVEERKAFNVCMTEFFQLYNISASYQTIENPEGRDPFQAPTGHR